MIARCASILLLFIVLSVPVWAGPALEISDAASFDFGKTIQHANVKHSFWLKSVGDDTLRITEVIPGCGCTKAPLLDSTLAPGDSTRLEIKFSTRSFRGVVSKRPYVRTNANDEKNYLTIEAELFPDVEQMWPLVITPGKVDVSQFTKRPRRRAKFLIENRSDQDYNITLVDASFTNFEVTLPKKVKAGETGEGVIVVDKDLIDETFEQSLTFRINDQYDSHYTVPVERKVRVKVGQRAGSSGK